RASRLWATAAGSSPQRAPRLKLSKGGREMPTSRPRRRVVSARTPGGAGQSARSSAESRTRRSGWWAAGWVGMGWGVVAGRFARKAGSNNDTKRRKEFVGARLAGDERLGLARLRILAQRLDQGGQVRRPRRLHLDRLAAARMGEGHALGMQRLAAEAAQHRQQRL